MSSSKPGRRRRRHQDKRDDEESLPLDADAVAEIDESTHEEQRDNDESGQQSQDDGEAAAAAEDNVGNDSAEIPANEQKEEGQTDEDDDDDDDQHHHDHDDHDDGQESYVSDNDNEPAAAEETKEEPPATVNNGHVGGARAPKKNGRDQKRAPVKANQKNGSANNGGQDNANKKNGGTAKKQQQQQKKKKLPAALFGADVNVDNQVSVGVLHEGVHVRTMFDFSRIFCGEAGDFSPKNTNVDSSKYFTNVSRQEHASVRYLFALSLSASLDDIGAVNKGQIKLSRTLSNVFLQISKLKQKYDGPLYVFALDYQRVRSLVKWKRFEMRYEDPAQRARRIAARRRYRGGRRAANNQTEVEEEADDCEEEGSGESAQNASDAKYANGDIIVRGNPVFVGKSVPPSSVLGIGVKEADEAIIVKRTHFEFTRTVIREPSVF